MLEVSQQEYKDTVEQDEKLRLELKETSRLEAVEKKRLEDLKNLRFESAVTLQCFARQYFARRRRRHKVFLRALDEHTRKNMSIKIQTQIRRYLALQYVAYLLHQKYLALCLKSCIMIQCMVRCYFAKKLVRFIRIDEANRVRREREILEEGERLEAARMARLRDAEEIERFRHQQSTMRKLAEDKKDRHLHILSRSTVLKRSKICVGEFLS